MTQTEVDTLARQARGLLAALHACLELPEGVNGAANALSDALHPFEEVREVDQRLIHVNGPPRCDECNAKMCDEHKDWLERVDALPSVCEVIRHKAEPKPWEPLKEAA